MGRKIALTKDQENKWLQEVKKRSEASKEPDNSDSSLDADLPRKVKPFVFNIEYTNERGDAASQYIVVFDCLDAIVRKYQDIYTKLEESYGRRGTADRELFKKADLMESMMTEDQKLAVFIAFHSGDKTLRNQSMLIIWWTNFRSIINWAVFMCADNDRELSYRDLFGDNIQNGNDARQEVLMELYELYESYDPFKKTAFNTYAEYYIPRRVASKMIKNGFSYNEMSEIRKVNAIADRIAKEAGATKKDIPADEIIREYSKRDPRNLYNSNGQPNKKYDSEILKLMEETGRDSFTREEVEAHYVAQSAKRLSQARLNKLINFNDVSVMSLNEGLGDDDDGNALEDMVESASQLGYSEDFLSPEQLFIRKEQEQEMEKTLLRTLRGIPNLHIIVDAILSYEETNPYGKAKEEIRATSKRSKLLEKKEIIAKLKEMFIDYVGTEYAAMTGTSMKLSKSYAEKAYHKLSHMSTGKHTADVSYVEYIHEEEKVRSNAELYEDLFQEDNNMFADRGDSFNGIFG